jgi:protein-tyrosine-phosphatase
MAECVLNRLGAGRFCAFSAGSQPKGEIHPFALNRLEVENYDTSELRSKGWGEFTRANAPKLDFVFTLCDQAAAEPCPVWPGQPMTAHWGMPDPAAVEGNEAVRHAAFADTMKMLSNRIGIFVSLPIRELDALTLKRELDKIGGRLRAK